jgi:FKBP-type peptidyl-prolyl cis-trans isomerase FkpA
MSSLLSKRCAAFRSFSRGRLAFAAVSIGIFKEQMMNKRVVLAILIAMIAVPMYGQTATKKSASAARPNTTAPTKVTGEGTKTPSGLQYWNIKVGTGQEAKSGDHVKVHYTGWLTSGKKFDSSVDAHQPFDFTIGRGDVIKGWEEGVTGMKVGGKRQLRIPPDLAYGKEGYPGAIPPNATLIFDIQLLGIVSK